MGEHRRLLDEFQLELQAQGIATLGEIKPCGVFGDLVWSPYGDIRNLSERAGTDPAFTITAYTRYVALARLVGEIRFFAAPIAEGAPSWWWNGQDPDRVAAVKSEPDTHEMAILGKRGRRGSLHAALSRRHIARRDRCGPHPAHRGEIRGAVIATPPPEAM